ncbi:hypothetical protein [Nocardioides sp. CFH 31398]|uniref:hypothetical protein n=1 Tax=Nocardioides sp. CFH 31398 TaxID=2919579 RepID=UPI001F05E108|nr:hypothetical protein [Nocardioides sp. CFH 31398]MCH1867046.1 hypothetical protein [Nocardioides sp. CFH 31398]
MRRTTAGVLTALLAGPALALGAVPAHAESVTVDDPTGDVSDNRWEASSEHDTVDVVHTTLDHQAARIVFRIDVVALAGPRGDPLSAEGRLRLPDGTDRWLTLALDGRGGKTMELEDDADEPVACEGMKGAFRRDTDRVVMSLPRSCVGDPEWVRFTAGMRLSWGLVSARDDARRPTSMDLPQQYLRRLGPEEVRPGEVR